MVPGIVGESERIDGTVVSSAVNMESRLEAFAGKLGSRILISRTTFEENPENAGLKHREPGKFN